MSIPDPERSYPLLLENIATEGPDDAPVLLSPNSVGVPVAYYAQRQRLRNPLYPVPGPYPVRDARYAYPAGNRGVPGLTRPDAARAADLVSSAPVVWLITRFRDLFDPSAHLEEALGTLYPCRDEVARHGGIVLLRYSRTGCGAPP